MEANIRWRMPIVWPARTAPEAARAPWAGVFPGSMAVAVYHLPGFAPDLVQVYFEGDLYNRPPEIAPTADELERYALIAAGRAADHSPTVARLLVPAAALVSLGYIDYTLRPEGTFDAEAVLLPVHPDYDPLCKPLRPPGAIPTGC